MDKPLAGPQSAPKADAYTLITGASSGIGAALAKVFAEHQHDLVLVARNQQTLQALADGLVKQHAISVEVIAMDLTVPRAARQLVDRLQAQNLSVDILVNNAGFGQCGTFVLADEFIQLQLIALNITCLTELTRLLLPAMIAHGRGKVMQVASIAGFIPGPLMSTYYASKAYVVSLTQALQCELRGSGVQMCALCPGPTATNFGKAAGITGTSNSLKRHRMSAEQVAIQAYADLMANKALSIPGWRNKLIVRLAHLLPTSWLATSVAKVMAQLQA